MKLAADNGAVHEGKLRAVAAIAQQALARRALLDGALLRTEAALALTPRDSDLLYVRARALEMWEEPTDLQSCGARRRDRDAAQALRTLIELDPSYEAMQTSFELGIVLTRDHAFAEAAHAYARSIELAWSPRDTAVAHSNMAEVTMLAGDPGAALVHYQRAIALSSGGRDYALSLFGLGVALDRLGEHDKALESCARGAETGGRSLAVLEADGVFFEPPYERHYYLALGQEALARLMPEARALLLETARAEYDMFVALAPESDPYRTAARANLESVQRELTALAKLPAAKPKAATKPARSSRPAASSR
ncbi:MAG TPA: tetratricopeptide repeat protein [Polyangiales bacterium]|nr:tetratricopeptide repeat protein [Polyangiales bacterium]